VEQSPSEQQLPTIVVSADQDQTLSAGQISKTSQVGMLGDKQDLDIPFSITSYTSKYIADQQATSVADALRSEPSVRSVFSKGGIGEYFNIRGLYTQSHELAWNGLFGLLPHNRVPTEFLERVDVFKGTSALLNGMSIGGAVGGVINVVPKRATSEDITRLTTTYKSDSTFGAHIDVGRRFGQEDQFGVRVNALKSLGDKALDGQEENRYLGSAAFDYKGEKFRASLDLYDINEKLDGGQPLMVSFATSVVPKAPDSKLNHQPGSYSHTKTRGAIAHVEYDFAPEWTAFASAGTKRQNGVGVIAKNALGNAAQPNGDYMAVSRMNANNTNVDAGELGVRGKFNT
ncbi:TonB-dependent receptor plug domain-containing protein, partial [Enterobacteriaceae bacterium TzEc051]